MKSGITSHIFIYYPTQLCKGSDRLRRCRIQNKLAYLNISAPELLISTMNQLEFTEDWLQLPSN